MDVQKDFGLLGNDLIKFEKSSIDISHIGSLKGYEANIRLLDNVRPVFCGSRPILIHMKLLVIDEIKKMVLDGILEEVTTGRSQWTCPIVAIKKPKGQIRICADYRFGLNYKICNDYFPIPNIQCAFTSLSNLSWFAKRSSTYLYEMQKWPNVSRSIHT